MLFVPCYFAFSNISPVSNYYVPHPLNRLKNLNVSAKSGVFSNQPENPTVKETTTIAFFTSDRTVTIGRIGGREGNVV